MAIVPKDQVWVDANFKEGQLRRIRVGQPASVIADANDVEYHVSSSGSGQERARRSVLPPQNVTGNWIKAVQRLPVRIALDAPGGRASARDRPLDGAANRRSCRCRRAGERSRSASWRPTTERGLADPERAVDRLIAEIIRRTAAVAGRRRRRPRPRPSELLPTIDSRHE